MVVIGTYNPHLVALSILVAAFASYTALDLGGRVAATRGVAPRMWLVPASIAMGGGIWSMHFIAMLAFNMPTPMSYDIGLTTLSLVVAILVTGAGFYFINRQSALSLSFVFSGVFMGLGIVAMHYIGMAAMREHAEISYDFLFVALSLVIAIGASTAALRLAFRTTDLGQKLVAAVVMGLAISGMHYSAMRGTTFAVHGPVHGVRGYASLDQTNLALVVAGITFVLLAFALIASLQQENSERQRAEERLRRSEAYLSEAQRLSHTGSFGWNPSSGKTYWTEEAFRIFEYDPAITPTLELLQLRIHPDDVAAFRQVMARSAQDGQDFAHEYRLRMPDARVKHIRVVARAFRDEAGDVDFVGALMDVTAIRLAELELHKTRSELAHVMRVTSLGELTASIAHEVSQPLGGVLINAEACQTWLDCDPPNMNEAHAALDRIARDGTRAGEVIRRIRALAKKTDTKMEPLDLNEALSEALTFVQHELLSSRVALRVEFASAIPVILADKVQLQQVILNLVINGIEAMQPITDRARELVIRSEQDDAQQVRVTVTDCGVGLSADSTDRLFNAFFTTKSSGMGMGLSICRSIIELHGGRIWAVPDVARGATIPALALASQATSLIGFQLIFGLMVGGATAAIFAPMMACVTGWFDTHRSLAVSLVSAGMGMAPMTMAPLAARLISNHDWRTSLQILAALTAVAMIPVALLVRRPPALESENVVLATHDEPQSGISLRQAIRSPQFITLLLTNFFCCATHSGPIFHTVSYAITCGIPLIAAVSIYSVEGLAGLGGRVAFGFLGDRFGAKRVLVSGLLLQAFGALAYFFVRDLSAFYAVAALFGFIYAGVMPLYAVLARENFPLRMMGTIIGGTAMAGSLGMATGPLAGGLIYDTFASYGWLYIGAWGIGIGAFLIALTFRPYAAQTERSPRHMIA